MPRDVKKVIQTCVDSLHVSVKISAKIWKTECSEQSAPKVNKNIEHNRKRVIIVERYELQ